MRAVVLFQTDDVFDLEFAFERTHVADFGPPESIDRLIIVTDGKQAGPLG